MPKFIHKLPKCFANCKLQTANSFVFNSAPDQYKTQEMCDKAVDNYSIALELVLDQY